MQPAQHPPAYLQGAPQQQTVVVQQQPVVTVQPGSNATPGAVDRRGSWCYKGLRITGYMQTVLGISAVLFGIISIILRSFMYFVGTPIWCGICFFIIAGILGIAAGGKKATGLLVGYMVMSIFSSMAAFGVMFVAGVSTGRDSHFCPDQAPGSYMYYRSRGCSSSSSARVGIDACILVIGLAEFVISIVGASFTCCGLYYGSSTTPQTVVTYQNYPQQTVVGAPPQGVYYPPGTTVAYPNQFVVQPAQPYQPQGQFQPPPQGQFQPPPQGLFQPPP